MSKVTAECIISSDEGDKVIQMEISGDGGGYGKNYLNEIVGDYAFHLGHFDREDDPRRGKANASILLWESGRDLSESAELSPGESTNLSLRKARMDVVHEPLHS